MQDAASQPPAVEAAVPLAIPPHHPHQHQHQQQQQQGSAPSSPSLTAQAPTHSPSTRHLLLQPSSASPSSPPALSSSASSSSNAVLKPRSSWSHLFSKPNRPNLTVGFTRRTSAQSIVDAEGTAGAAAAGAASTTAASSQPPPQRSLSINVDDVDLDAKEHAAPPRGSRSSSMSTSVAAQPAASTSSSNDTSTPSKLSGSGEPSTPSAASLLRRWSGSVLQHPVEPASAGYMAAPSSLGHGNGSSSTSVFSSSPAGSIGRSLSAYKMNGAALYKQGSSGGSTTTVSGPGAVSGALMQINSSLASSTAALAGSAVSTAPTTPVGAIDVPKSSILLNPIRRRSVVDTWRWDSAGLNPALAQQGASPPLTILRVPVVASARERREAAREAELAAEKAREREREKQKEKEREAEAKLWGIPKKAFYLGLPDLNFNSQASMLAGWGNGSGTTDFRPTPRPQSAHGTHGHGRSHSVTSGGIGGGGESSRRDSTQRDRDRERERAERERERERERKKEEEERAKDAEMDEPMDPEELAALNAIINTRRSAASAMALASGAVKFGEPSNAARRGSQASASAAEQRPGLAPEGRTPSHESVPHSRPSLSTRRGSNESSIPGSPDKAGSARIRFAPLPQPFGPLPSHLAHITPYPNSNAGDSATDLDANREQSMQQLTGAGLPRTDSLNDYADDESASDDEGWARRFSSGKGKWYLMGMPSSVFKPQSYKSKRPRTADGADLERRVSTGSFGVVSSLEADRRLGESTPLSASAGVGAASSDEARGRRRARRRLSSKSTRAASTRSSSVGSADEDERQRRRELIRASRPGGTGMVTLPDGTKMKARRVADAETDYDEPDLNEWGFAGLAKEARRSMAIEGATPTCLGDLGFGEAQDSASAAEEAEGSDTVDGTLKRRRREGSSQSAKVGEAGQFVQEPLSIEADHQESSTDTVEPPPVIVEKTLSPHLPPQPPVTASTVSLAPMGLKLSAEKAAEVRRRHEDEVAALGAEVLANIHKNKAKAAAAAAESAHTRISSNGSDAPRTAAAAVKQQEQDRPATPKRKPSLAMPLRKPSVPTPSRKQSSNTGSGTGPSTPKLGGESRLVEVDEPITTPVATPSKTAGLAASGSATLSPHSIKQHGSPAAGSARELSPAPSHASRSSRVTSSSEHRAHHDASVGIPHPSDRLPRRPDARGYAVVALPGAQQLGLRPPRPREGRVWQFDDDDEDFMDSETGDESEEAAASRSDDEEDEMDQEELEEEERRTAAQKKRATTRAAGQEVMSANKARSAKQSNAAADTFDNLMLGPRGGVGSKASPLRTTASSAALPKSKQSGKNVRGTASLTSLGRKSRSSAPKPLTPPEVDEIDDAELWPPSIAQTLGARRPSTAVREEHAVRAKLVRERRMREEKEKEKLKKQLKKEADADPDWGWVSARGGGPLAMGAASTTPVTSVDVAAAHRSSSRPRAK